MAPGLDEFDVLLEVVLSLVRVVQRKFEERHVRYKHVPISQGLVSDVCGTLL